MNSIDYKGLTSYLFLSELKSELDKYLLGPVWWVLEPCLFVGVFYFLFAHLKGSGDFVYALVCGITTWRWMMEIVNQGGASVFRKKSVLQNFRVHPFVFPLVSLLVSTLKYIFILMCVLALLATQNVLNFGNAVDFSLWVFCAILTSFSYGVFFSVIMPFVPDVQIVISRGTMLMMFLSGVIFPIHEMSEMAQRILFWNPFAHIIEGVRDLLLYGERIDPLIFLVIIGTHLPILIFSYFMLGRLRGEIPKRLI
ncbi:ABC transporter permease [Microbulbifer agarilyticus]|uniref:ABC transporter permease n=1 Tax=Microbulbifer agarilyticus TaxID=260552 RepID=UPI001CD2121F|nr:ABC transporter permease [Microbulbifer agarilyticus]MCA0901396.1 ABC transporter permease [Microbulbifer agarilyticus]